MTLRKNGFDKSGSSLRADATETEPQSDLVIENAPHNNLPPKDLGRPPMGWMPRDQIMQLVRQIDAEVNREQPKQAENADV